MSVAVNVLDQYPNKNVSIYLHRPSQIALSENLSWIQVAEEESPPSQPTGASMCYELVKNFKY